MPNAASFRRVVLVCERRAWALRLCVYSSSATAASRISRAAVRPSPHERTSAAAAVRTWQTVNSGFFPPQLLPYFRQEQVTHGGDCLMTYQSPVRPPLEVIEAKFGLLVLEAALHCAMREGHVQQFFHRRIGCRVADEEFHSQNVAHVATTIKCNGSAEQAVLILGYEHHVLGFPNHRTLLRVFDAEARPSLVFQVRRPVEVIFDTLRRRRPPAPNRGTARPRPWPCLREGRSVTYGAHEPTGERAAPRPHRVAREQPIVARTRAFHRILRRRSGSETTRRWPAHDRRA